jgi:hypothetical protein
MSKKYETLANFGDALVYVFINLFYSHHYGDLLYIQANRRKTCRTTAKPQGSKYTRYTKYMACSGRAGRIPVFDKVQHFQIRVLS